MIFSSIFFIFRILTDCLVPILYYAVQAEESCTFDR